MSNSDSSENELLKLSDDDDDANPENINIGDFLLIKFEKKKSVVDYVAKVISKYNLTESYIFVFPNVEDQATIDFRDVFYTCLNQIVRRA